MFKNVAGQKIACFAFEYGTGVNAGSPKTGDAANISLYVDKDWAGLNQLADTGASEISSTNAPGWYLFDVLSGESNADVLLFTGKSTTANVTIVGQQIYTLPPFMSTLAISASGVVNANTVQTASETLFNYDGTIASATATTVTLATPDANGNTIPNNGQFAFHEMDVVIGTGVKQRVKLTTPTGSALQYNVLSGTMVTQLNSTSKYIMLSTWSNNIISINGVDASGVTVVAANIGTTQPLNFTGTGTGAMVKDDVTAISTDTGAADNLERYTDGTEFMPVDTLKQNFNATGTTLTAYGPDGTTPAYTKTITVTVSTSGITATVKN